MKHTNPTHLYVIDGDKPEIDENSIRHSRWERFKKDGKHDPEASARAWFRHDRRGVKKRLALFLFCRVRAAYATGHHSRADRWGAIYDWLCAATRIEGKEWYYDLLHARTEFELARARADEIRLFLAGLGYTEKDTPASVAKTLADRHTPPRLSQATKDAMESFLQSLKSSVSHPCC